MNFGLIVRDNKVVVNSRRLAQNYDKEHKNVLRDIRNIIEAVPAAKLNFELSEYVDSTGRKLPEYIIDRQGFSMLVMGFTGEQAKQFTYKYTLAFEEMAKQIHQIPQTYPEALRLAANLAEENLKLKPKAEMHDRFLSSDSAQTMAVVAKSLGTGRDRLFKFLRERKVLMGSNVPYQPYLDRGYFKVIEKVINMGGEEIIKPQTLVTSKGVDYIAKILKEGA